MRENILDGVVFYWDYLTNSYEIFVKLPTNDKDALRYIPNTKFSHVMYGKFRKLGFNIKESLKKVLEIHYGNSKDN